MKSKDFAKWMDDNAISVEQAAELFGCSVKNVYNWRSEKSGIPLKKQKWVAQMVAQYESDHDMLSQPSRLSIPMTDRQLDDWSEAALNAKKTLKQWAIDELEAAAHAAKVEAALPPNPAKQPFLNRLNEPSQEYGKNDK